MHKNWIVLVLIASGVFNSYSQKKAFTHPDFEVLQKSHKTLAIVPILTLWNGLDFSTQPNQPKFLEEQAFKTQEILIEYFENSRKSKLFSIEIQSFKETQQKLHNAQISLEELSRTSPKALCKVLNVDAVLLGTLRLEAVQYPNITKETSLWENLTGKDFIGTLSLKLSDRKTGKLLWKYAQLLAKNNGKTLEQILKDTSKKIGRKFPYLKRGSD